MKCVCGDWEIEHERTELSVPLIAEKPVELTPSQINSMYGHIAKMGSNPTRETHACQNCGCMSFERDTGVW